MNSKCFGIVSILSAVIFSSLLASCGGSSSGGSPSPPPSTGADTTPPVISTPSNLVVEADDPSGIPITHPDIIAFINASSVTDNVDPNPVITHDAPDQFPLGFTVVNFTATDSSGNSSQASATLLVTLDPVIYCDIATSSYCEDFSDIATGEIPSTPQGDFEFSISNPKGSVYKDSEGGFVNAFYVDTGAIKVVWNDGQERGLGFGMNTYAIDRLGLETANDIYMGVMVWVSTDSLRAMNAEEWKHMAAETWNGSDFGSRPTLFMYPIRDTRDEVSSSLSNYNAGSTGEYYWVPIMASDANGNGATDEYDNSGFYGATSHYLGGDNHAFRWNDYADEWVYVEIKFSTVNSSNPNHELFIYTQDGVYQGSRSGSDSPMISVSSMVDHGSDGTEWFSLVPHYYLELTAGTSSSTFIKYDNFQLDTSFMGPPIGFIN